MEHENEQEEDENGQEIKAEDQVSKGNEGELLNSPLSNDMEINQKVKKKDDEDQQLANGLSKIKLSEEMFNRTE